MAGESLRQARAALQHALGSLSRDDYFNVIRFDNHFEPLFPESRPADVVSVHSAARFVRSLEAHGGTEMSGALDAALADPGLPVAVRQVVFVTDGAVADEARLFQQIEQQLGRTRLFPIGIGSAPNRHFLTRAARFGRGVTVAIARQSEVEQRIDELLDKIERPVLTGLEVHWNDPVEMWPARLPDLHAGEPLIVSARLPRLVGAIDLSAQRSDRPWTLSLPLAPAQEERGVAKLWARRKIAALMDARRRGEAPQTTRAAIVEVALRHGLVSRFTSLVAQDVTPARPSHAALSRRPVPTPLGRSEARFAEIGTLAGGGVLPAGATPSPFLLVAGIVCCLLSALGLRGQGGGRS